MGCGSSGENSGVLLQQQGQQNKAINTSIGQIQNAFSGFTPNFYNNYAQSYVNSQMPSLQQQYNNNSQQLGFKYANQGLGKSTQQQQGFGALQDANNSAKTQIAQQGQQAVQQLQQQVAGQEGNLIGMAETANQPGQLGVNAQAQAASLQAPSTFAPIGNMFSQFASQYLGSQQQNLGNSLLQSLNNMALAPQGFGAYGALTQ